jgi:hypothetical protein
MPRRGHPKTPIARGATAPIPTTIACVVTCRRTGALVREAEVVPTSATPAPSAVFVER